MFMFASAGWFKDITSQNLLFILFVFLSLGFLDNSIISDSKFERGKIINSQNFFDPTRTQVEVDKYIFLLYPCPPPAHLFLVYTFSEFLVLQGFQLYAKGLSANFSGSGFIIS